jgi:hypothetical protein
MGMLNLYLPFSFLRDTHLYVVRRPLDIHLKARLPFMFLFEFLM